MKSTSPEDIDAIQLHILELLQKYQGTNPINAAKWVDGWKENLDLFVNTSNIESALIPKYATKQRFIQINGKYFHNENNTLTKIHRQILNSLLKKFTIYRVYIGHRNWGWLMPEYSDNS